MNKQLMHELAKFGAGVILGDFLAVLWLISNGNFPVSFFGADISVETMAPVILFDIALFIILVHYGWHLGKTPRLRTHAYFLTIGIVLGVVSIAHLLRVFTGADVVLLGWAAPLWISYIASVVAAYLSYMSFYLSVRMR
jgi:hypothetical protein